jgi:serine/threonine protein kinase
MAGRNPLMDIVRQKQLAAQDGPAVLSKMKALRAAADEEQEAQRAMNALAIQQSKVLNPRVQGVLNAMKAARSKAAPPVNNGQTRKNTANRNNAEKKGFRKALRNIGVEAPDGLTAKELAALLLREGTEYKQLDSALRDLGFSVPKGLTKQQLRDRLESAVVDRLSAVKSQQPPPPPEPHPFLANERSRSAAAAGPTSKAAVAAATATVSAETAAKAPDNYLCLSRASANITRNGARHLCDKNFTKRIIEERATITEIIPSKKIGEGGFGSVQSAEIYLKTEAGETITCIGAFKTATKKQSALSNDTLNEIACYARLQRKPCIAKGMFIKLMASQEKTVMEHYLKNMFDISTMIIVPKLNPLRINLELFAKATAYQMLTGLKGMHEEHIIHRDIKPENTLLAYDGAILMADFGLSIHVPVGYKYNREHSYAGTPLYYSPEMADLKGNFGSKTDIWSVGATIFMFLVGEDLLLKEPNDAASFNRVSQRLSLLNTRPFRYSAECQNFMRGMLAIDPARRYSAAQALQDHWFDGMDLESARSTIERLLGDRCVRIQKTTVNATRKRGNAGTVANRNVANYLRIEDLDDVEWTGPAAETPEYVSAVHKMFGAGIRFETLLHAIELFDRLCAITGEVKAHYSGACILTAIMLNDRERAGSKADRALEDQQRRLVEYLRGDIYACKRGFVTAYCKAAYDAGIIGVDAHVGLIGRLLGIQFGPPYPAVLQGSVRPFTDMLRQGGV